MNLLLLSALVLHILLGTAAIAAYAGLPLLIRGKEFNAGIVKIYSILGFLGFLCSWIFGGYYYSSYYGRAIKPGILESATPWVHKILMESKEHVFLFLPFLAFVVLILVNFFPEELKTSAKLKMNLILLCVLVVTLGIIVTLSGVAISGTVVASKP